MNPTPDSTGSQVAAGDSLVRGSRWVASATMTVGAVNYLYALALTRLLEVADYAVFAAGQALLLIAGTIATASVPWVLAKQLAAHGHDRAKRRDAVGFAVFANVAQALAAATVVVVVAVGFASAAETAWIAGGAAAIFLASTTTGWLQGHARFSTLAATRVGEVVIKAVAGTALVLVGAGAAGALAGFALGAIAIALLGVWLARADIRPTSHGLRSRELWSSARGIVAIQALVALLSSVDVIAVALLPAASGSAASYQVSMILARIPLFLAGAVAIVAFPLLSGAGSRFAVIVERAVRMYWVLALPLAAVMATVPAALIRGMFPDYPLVSRLLPLTVVAGTAFGVVNLLTTFFQSSGRYRASLRVQIAGVVFHIGALVAGWYLGGIMGFAIGAAVGGTVAAGLLLRRASTLWHLERPRPRAVVSVALIAATLMLATHWLWLWLPLAGLVGLLATLAALGRAHEDADEVDVPRILHLGFEDFRRPGSGGGALRTHEVNRRLAADYEITVLTAGWRGAVDRTEDGVHYRHIGIGRGYMLSILTYFVSLPLVAPRFDADLVVEDFAAPFSSALTPLWDRRPVLAVVQWLNAREKSRQYKLPFFLVEALGVRLHRRFIAMSDDLADRIRAMNPDSEVTVIGNGVQPEAFTVDAHPSGDVVFLGRLENAQKGVDLLLDAFAAIADEVAGRLVLVGDGPDADALRKQAGRLGIADRVHFAGRVDGSAKFELLAGAAVVAMPSRFETFGIVAAEALACGTPVVAFDIPCLRSVIPSDAGVLVPPFDVSTFARALHDLLADDSHGIEMGRRGRDWARQYDWDRVAAAQAEVYEQMLRSSS